MKALAQAVPGQVSAGVGNLNVVAYSGLRGEGHWVHMEIYEAAYGGRAGKDGMDAVDVLFTNTRNNPIEDVESHFPMRIRRYELRDGVCAPGHWRGGIGPIRETELLDDAGFSIEGEGQRFPPWGHDGGAEGRPSRITLVRADGSEQALPSKLAHMKAAAGDRVIVTSCCGGGYGDPLQRTPEQVLADVADGHITVEAARRDYGVIVTDALALDDAATARERTKRAGPVPSESPVS